MEDQEFTHIIVDIHPSDAYFKDREKMVGMHIRKVDGYRPTNLDRYDGNFFLSKEDNKTLGLHHSQHNFLSARIRKLTDKEINELNN